MDIEWVLFLVEYNVEVVKYIDFKYNVLMYMRVIYI